MSTTAQIEFGLYIAARQFNMAAINNLISSLDSSQRAEISKLVIEEAMKSAVKNMSQDPLGSASVIVTLMQAVGSRLSPETIDMAVESFPSPKYRRESDNFNVL